MKRIPKITAILMVIAVIFGCHEEPEPVEPYAPTLIEPEDGAVFDTLLPENFIWSADGWKEEFYLYLAVGSVAETLIISGDTSIEFTPLTGLDGTIDGYYEWAVASIAEDEDLGSDTHSFTINTQKYGPTLLSPDDSSVVYGQSLVFSWTSDRPADMYTLYILSDYLIFQNVSDTFYDLSSSEYSDLQAGDYTWYVTRHVGDWRFPSETRHFTIAEPIDLDTTYFPFGLGYEWKFEQHKYGWADEDEWSNYDTFRIWVVDSFWEGDTLFIQLLGEGASSYPGQIYELSNPVKILNDSIPISMPGYYFTAHDTIPLSAKHDTTLTATYGLTSAYSGNLLSINLEYGTDMSSEWCYQRVSRQKGIGTLSQEFGCSWSWGSSTTSDRLLYFYNGQDTVYKAE